MHQIIEDVLLERRRQDEKWGEQNHNAFVWASIIGEEYGEMCKAINEFSFDPTPETEQDIYKEAIQTMASCMAMLECMERNRKKVVKCKDCLNLMFSDCYGECGAAYKGIVHPDDSCGKGEPK